VTDIGHTNKQINKLTAKPQIETNNDKDKRHVDTVFANEILIEILGSWMKYLNDLKLLRLFMYRESYIKILMTALPITHTVHNHE
jgi:hypothetical protein